ncbi:uncharacterized protein LOC134701274 isoform X2 [Mytilus trossulus]|uniref:uncharacterized protein LOC134701274 isoform X2 n=1 Tax=Mytilus trossulus TaxID=6551 RepID=UPI0030050115
MARLDVPLVFCGYTFYTVLLLLHLTSLTVSQSTTDSSTNTAIAPTTVNNNLSVTDTEATELFSSNYPSSSISSNNSDESISPSSSSMFIDSTSNSSIAISVNSSIAISVNSSIDMSPYKSSSSPVNMMSSSNLSNLLETSENPMTESMPNMQSSSDTVTVTSTSVYNSNSNNQNSLSQTTSGFQPEITQTTDILETNSPMITTGLNTMTSIDPSPSSIETIESSEPIDLESSVSEYLTSSDIEATSSILATENPSLTSVGTEMTSTPIVDASSSVSTDSLKSDMPSSSETPISSEIQSASSSVSSLGIVPSSTVIAAASSSNIQVSSSVLPMTTTTSTTTPTPSTTTIPPSSTLADDIQSSIDGNSLFEVNAALDIICGNMTSDEELRGFIQGVLKTVEAVKKVVVVKNGCPNKTRRKRAASALTSEVKMSVDANTAAENPKAVANQITEAFKNNTKFNLTDADNFRASAQKTFNDSCKAGVCNNLYGYMCTRINSTHGTCTSRCKGETCSDHGTCSTIVTDSNVFGHHCSCHSEEYYKYEGDNCEDKRMKWELAVAIAAGSGGAVILILVFVLIICCCCKNKGDKYGYDRRHSYEPMSDVIGRSGPAYYRNDTKNQQPGFTNLGYDDDKYSDYSDPSQTRPPNGQSWNPEDSKDTYAKITEQLDQEKRFEIKRPQVSGSIRQNSSAEATTGF